MGFQEDTAHLREKCDAMVEQYERSMERDQDRVEREQNDRLNQTLFILTVATAIFAPVQFIAGVYGMNFVDADSKPTIPELTWVDGYWYFWIVVAVYLFVSGSLAWCL